MNNTIKIAIALECAAKYRETGGNDLINAVVELRRLEAANADLLAALKMNAQALSWLAFGECRGFTDDLPTAREATGAARAAIKKHGGAA